MLVSPGIWRLLQRTMSVVLAPSGKLSSSSSVALWLYKATAVRLPPGLAGRDVVRLGARETSAWACTSGKMSLCGRKASVEEGRLLL